MADQKTFANAGTKYNAMRREIDGIDHVITLNEDNGYSQDYARACTELLTAKALIDIAEKLDDLVSLLDLQAKEIVDITELDDMVRLLNIKNIK